MCGRRGIRPRPRANSRPQKPLVPARTSWTAADRGRSGRRQQEGGRRQPIKITKISAPVQDHRQAGRFQLHQEADALGSQVEREAAASCSTENTVRNIAYRHGISPKNKISPLSAKAYRNAKGARDSTPP